MIRMLHVTPLKVIQRFAVMRHGAAVQGMPMNDIYKMRKLENRRVLLIRNLPCLWQ
jgi:hypothetical protein